MARLDSLRDRLPSLYRPDADETSGPPIPLGRDDLAELLADGGAVRFAVTQRDGSLIVRRGGGSPVRALRLAPGRAPGAGYALEVRTLRGGGAFSPKPIAVLAVSDSTALVGTTPLPETFVLQLRQRGLLTRELTAVAGVLERLNREAGEVMQAHWFVYADRAVHSPFFLRSRALEGLGVPGLSEPPVRHFPYIEDLGRLASLLSLPPWQEPLVQEGGAEGPETVETYRQRVSRIVALYTNGLGTIEAVRRITEAQLPVEVDALPEERDRPFAVEEHAPLATVTAPAHVPGLPSDRVGPLMHWPLSNDGAAASTATVFVQAATEAELAQVDADGEPLFAAAAAPVLELYRGGALRTGLAYRDTIPAGKTLRIAPTYASWLALDGGVAAAASEDDPTAPGPWSTSPGGPAGAVAALLRTAENTLWAGSAGELWRNDGAGWTRVLADDAAIHCLAEDGGDLLLGTDAGLVRVGRFPDGGFSGLGEPASDGRAVHALARASDGTFWAGTSEGLGALGPADTFAATAFKAEIRAVATDASGAVYAGGEFGLVAYRPQSDEWWWYSGGSATDEVSEWRPFDPSATGGLPDGAEVFLPPVTAVRRARDGALWIGTEAGLARYVARGDGGAVAFRTLLEAFPDLCPGRVDALVEDERALLWACTERGLLRYDGRDFFQFRSASDTWVQLGRADSLYSGGEPVARGAWRFRRGPAAWERFDRTAASAGWVVFAGATRTVEEPHVHAVAFTDGLVADLLDQWSPVDFSTGGEPISVGSDRFALRVKLDGDTRVAAGGIPALPRLPPGTSEWRYLSLEPGDAALPAGRPAWTIEGRLLPAEAAVPDPEPGRYDFGVPDPLDEQSEFDEAVFAFTPAARVGFSWEPRRPFSVLVRLGRRRPGDGIEPAALDRIFAGVQQVRPAGVRAALAFGDKRVREET